MLRNPLPPETKLPLLALAGALFLGAGCDRGAAPGEKAAEGLAQAREGLEQARESIETMRERSESLGQQIEKQRREVDQLVEKRLELLRRQLDALEERVRRLPVEREAETKQRLAQLLQKRDEVAGKLKAYRDAAPQRSAESLRQLDEALDQFQAEYEGIEKEVSAPQAGGNAPAENRPP